MDSCTGFKLLYENFIQESSQLLNSLLYVMDAVLLCSGVCGSCRLCHVEAGREFAIGPVLRERAYCEDDGKLHPSNQLACRRRPSRRLFDGFHIQRICKASQQIRVRLRVDVPYIQIDN